MPRHGSVETVAEKANIYKCCDQILSICNSIKEEKSNIHEHCKQLISVCKRMRAQKELEEANIYKYCKCDFCLQGDDDDEFITYGMGGEDGDVISACETCFIKNYINTH